MPIWKNYHLATDISDALAALENTPGTARCVAGGTDLLLDLQQGRQAPVETLVDVTNIPELTALELRENKLFIGAAVPLNQIVQSPLVKIHAQALSEACGLIGGPQVRNTASLGGNVAHALPAADGAIALVALQAEAEVASKEGHRIIPILDLYAGPGRSTLDLRKDLLVGFHLDLKNAAQASVHRRVMRPQGVAIAILNIAVWLSRYDDHIAETHIAIGPAGPIPLRARNTEAFLNGKFISKEVILQAKAVLLNEARFRTSQHRATAEYRQRLSSVLFEETLQTAWARSFS